MRLIENFHVFLNPAKWNSFCYILLTDCLNGHLDSLTPCKRYMVVRRFGLIGRSSRLISRLAHFIDR